VARRHINNDALDIFISNLFKGVGHDRMVLTHDEPRPHRLNKFKEVGFARRHFFTAGQLLK
jgi:hypothetical protein